jgi:mono/diheme cytochrome c family protein/rhodanese-related sulfurtransferase
MQVFKTSVETERLPSHLPELTEFSNFPYDRLREWKSFYYMYRGFIQYPNGVVGVATIKVVVDDLESARDEYRKMGLLEIEDNTTEDDMVRFRIKRNQELHVTTPQSPDDDLAGFLKQHGSGVYAVVFEVKDVKETHDFLASKLPSDAATLDTLSNRISLKKEYAYGVQFEFIQEPEEQARLARQLNLNYGSTLDSTASKYAHEMYVTYCALCHGDNREGYAADNAPSLRSLSLLASGQSSNFLKYAIQYGRTNTAMAGYAFAQGGPLEEIEVNLLLKWLSESSGVEEPLKLSREPVKGDVELGSRVYAATCATCHGANGEGITAPALGNPMLLATASDHFLRYAIAEGRDGTPMVAYKDSLSDDEIDAVTAFLRSRASGWDVPKPAVVSVPTPDQYVLNPDGMAPEFDLRDGLYVSAAQLSAALKEGRRFVLLDARSEVAWRQTHIPGAIPVPYYKEPETFVNDLPNDDTWIVAYCACPHAASGQVISTLRKYGFKNTAILDEGVLVWTQMGYPVQSGE